MKKILVTAGGTQEYIDDVRVLTNISTGKLGAKISEELVESGFEVHHVCTRTSTLPSVLPPKCYIHFVKTAKDAMETMKSLIIEEKIDAVVHSMAVSDFTFKRDKAIKCKSNDPEGFIDFMKQMITTNPKIISFIKQWRPETILVGFKFEVGLTENDLIALAENSIEKNGCDLVIANDKKEMEKLNTHIARFVFSEKMKKYFKNTTAYDKKEIAKSLKYFLVGALHD